MTLAPSNINWTKRIWPIVEGCDPVSPGCLNCWAGEFVGGRLAPAEEVRAAAKLVPERFRGLTVLRDGRHVFNGTVRFQAQLLDAPLRHKAPDRVFVAPRSDLFHEAITDEQIAAAFGVMAACPHLTFQVLTKRAERAARWFAWVTQVRGRTGVEVHPWYTITTAAASHGADPRGRVAPPYPWPLPNVHIGVTVDDRKHGLPRVNHLRQIPATVRWLSIEPQLEDLGDLHLGTPQRTSRVFDRTLTEYQHPDGHWDQVPPTDRTTGIHWVVCGGESGHRARPFALEWADDVRRQCAAAGVAFWMKQAGSNAYLENVNYWPGTWPRRQRPAPEGVTATAAVGLRLRHPHGEDMDELPEALRVRELPRIGG